MSTRLIVGCVVTSLVAVASVMGQSPGLNFFNMVAIGDSLAAGVISGGWNASGQNNSFVAQFARHVRTFVFQPLIAEPGIPAENVLVRAGFPPEIAPKPGTSTGRIGPILPTNLAVPGANLSSALRERPNLPIDSPVDLVLGIPSLVIPGSAPIASQVEMAEFLRPSVAIVWIGSNDALGAVTGGTPSRLTPLDSFTADYRAMVTRLRAAGANLILVNVPDVTAIPAVVSIPAAAELSGVPPAFITLGLGVSPSDYLLLNHLSTYLAKLQGQSPAPLRDDQVLTADEAGQIRQRIREFNSAIFAIAQENQAVYVDINGAFLNLTANGLQVGSKLLTTRLFGGFFSLDGVHPTYTGQAWVANEIVNALNRTLNLNLPPINIGIVMASDPLVF